MSFKSLAVCQDFSNMRHGHGVTWSDEVMTSTINHLCYSSIVKMGRGSVILSKIRGDIIIEIIKFDRLKPHKLIMLAQIQPTVGKVCTIFSRTYGLNTDVFRQKYNNFHKSSIKSIGPINRPINDTMCKCTASISRTFVSRATVVKFSTHVR